MKIELKTVIIISNLYKYVPARTPNRLNVINKFAEEMLDASINDSGNERSQKVLIKLHDEEGVNETEFKLDLSNLARLSQNLVSLEQAASFIDCKILLPSKIFCCQKALNILDAHATILI